MKCPKCGYNSFECNDTCTKCSHDLSGYKDTYGLKGIVLPAATRAAMAESMAPELTMNNHPADDTDDNHEDMFSFDAPEEEAAAPHGGTNIADDPFSFVDEAPAAPPQTFGDFAFESNQPAPTEEDVFADLLEQTPAGGPAPKPAPAPAKPASSGPGEFDLENFSWDDTPVAAGGTAAPPEDDFDSLFGDKDEEKK